MERLVCGLFKVNVAALLLLGAQQDALVQLTQPGTDSLKLYAAFRLASIYPFFLYANFSGYIDMVMAVARLMRLRLPENFDRPFAAASFIDFWSRWHITLSSWLKTYIYNPLLTMSMRRIATQRLKSLLGVLCFFATFFLVGIWHGRTTEFVFFGVLQGGGVAINKLWQIALSGMLGRKRYKQVAAGAVYTALARGLTFTWFSLTLFWFWGDWKRIASIYAVLGMERWCAVGLGFWLIASSALALWEGLRRALMSLRTSAGPILASRYFRVVYASAMGLTVLAFLFFSNQPAPDIVYKAF